MKNLNADDLLVKLHAIGEFNENQPRPWANEVAKDMNRIVGRAIWWVETEGDDTDLSFGNAVLRIVERVEEFEGIERKPITT